MNILIKNISPTSIKQLKEKMPTANLSMIVRALITHALSMSNEQFIKIVNQQANSELKEKDTQ